MFVRKQRRAERVEMPRPFELSPKELADRLDEMVDATISDLVSEFLLMPMGESFLRYPDFRVGYEVLKRQTDGFRTFTAAAVARALDENSRAFGVVRAMLGVTPPEWAELARTELNADVTQGAARALDKACREDPDYIGSMRRRVMERLARARMKGGAAPPPLTLVRINALVAVAVDFIVRGAPPVSDGVIHRLEKFDTAHGIGSVQHAAQEHVPYAAVLYERYLGRPFATHRDAVSELVGEVMENAVEELLGDAGVSYRKTKRAERLPDFDQAPDFCIPDEISPVVVIEAKITSDDGTARDKVARIKVLAAQQQARLGATGTGYEVVACIDGRGFRERRQDMRQLLMQLQGKVFTTASLSSLITHTRIRDFVTKQPGSGGTGA